MQECTSCGLRLKGSASVKRITYQEADETALTPVPLVEDICAKHEIAPGTAALHFSVRVQRMASTIVGVSRPERVQQSLDWVQEKADDAVWDDVTIIDVDWEDAEISRTYVSGWYD